MTAATRANLRQLEESGQEPAELLVVLAWLVRDRVGVAEQELKAARRRAMFVLAAGGDPHRDLALESVAAERLAAELDTPARRSELAAALAELDERAEGLAAVGAALAALRAEPELAWRSFALALLADEFADE